MSPSPSPISTETEMNKNQDQGQGSYQSSGNRFLNTQRMERSRSQINFNPSDSSSEDGDRDGDYDVGFGSGGRGDHDRGLEMEPSSSTESFGVGSSTVSIPMFGTLIPNRVFVGGISSHSTESELLQLFSGFGTVKATKIIMDRSGISKGYGFVTFEREEEARWLINAVNNGELSPFVLRDRRLNIAPAVKKQPLIRPNGIFIPQGYGGGPFPPPPFDPFYCGHGQGPQGVPPPHQPAPIQIPLPENFNFFQPQPNPFQPGVGQPFHAIPDPNFGIGQTLPCPNGGVYLIPYIPPPSFQQPFYA